MGEVYELSAASAALPISVVEARGYLRSDEGEDATLGLLLRAVVQHAEAYTGVDLRANTWLLTLDAFPANDRICIAKHPVASITSITRLVWDDVDTNVPTAVPTADYYLKRAESFSEVLLFSSAPTGSTATGSWPTDVSEQQPEKGIVVTFVTEAPEWVAEVKTALLHHLAALWANRGDCLSALSAAGGGRVALHQDMAAQSGADALLDHYRIARI